MIWIATLVTVFLIRSSLGVDAEAGPYQEPGFKDFVKHPELLDALDDEERAELARIEAARAWSDEEVAAAARRYVLEDTADGRLLGSLGDRVHAPVLALLKDSKLWRALPGPEGRDGPFDRACRLLGDEPPAAAVALVLPFLDDPSPDVRDEAALLLGKAATPEAVPALQKLLRGTDPDSADFALIGLKYPIERGRLHAEVRAALFEDVRAFVAAGKGEEYAAEVLLGMDREKASAFLLSDGYWRSRPQTFDYALGALADAKVPAPLDRLRALIKEMEAPDPKTGESAAPEGAYRLLGQGRAPEDRKFLEARMAGPDASAAVAAARGLLAFHDLEGFLELPFDEEAGKPNRSRALFYAAWLLDAEVCNGGFSQYFFNSTGDEWPLAVQGLKAMGMIERARILDEAVARFGKTPPATDRERRLGQLAEVAKRDDKTFDALDSRWYACKEDVELASIRFVLSHAEDFRGPAPADRRGR